MVSQCNRRIDTHAVYKVDYNCDILAMCHYMKRYEA